MKTHNTTGSRIAAEFTKMATDIGNALRATHLWWMQPRQEGSTEAVIRLRPQKYAVLNFWPGELLASIWSSGEEEGAPSPEGPEELYRDHEVTLPSEGGAQAVARAIKAQLDTGSKRTDEPAWTDPGPHPGTDSRDWLLNELDGDMRNPGVDIPGPYAYSYTRDRPGHPGTEDHSVLYLRLLYAWLPVLDDAGYRVPKLKTWDADWGGDPDLNDAERAITSQLQNASPQQIRAYEMTYSERKIGMRQPMGRAEEKFVTDHLSTPWKKTGLRGRS